MLPRGLGSSGLEDFVHRDFAALFGAISAVAIGSLAVFSLRDRAARAGTDGSGGPTDGRPGADAGAAERFPALRQDEELALVGIVLAVMADRLEHDPAAHPLLACAAARLVTARPVRTAWNGTSWTGLTERARRAAVEVLRPAALSTLVRAATWGIASDLERL